MSICTACGLYDGKPCTFHAAIDRIAHLESELARAQAEAAAMRVTIETIHAGMGERNWIYEACERALSRNAGRALAECVKKLETALRAQLDEPTRWQDEDIDGRPCGDVFFVCNHCGSADEKAEQIEHEDGCRYVIAKAALDEKGTTDEG